MTIVEFFDPLDIQHVRAYDHFHRTGEWPREFHELLKQNNIELPALYSISLWCLMAEKWIEHVLAVADRWKKEDD